MSERRRGRIWWKILLAVVGVLVIGVVGVYWYMRPLLLTGTGYAAHNACAVEHISDRSNPATDLPPNPLVPYLSVQSLDDGRVQASILGLFAKQTAWYTEGFGCALADERPELPGPTDVTDVNPLLTAAVAPANPALEAALDDAFADGLGTRAVVVVKDGEILAERYAAGFTPETPQLSWSMSKSMTNLLVGRVVADEGLDIHAPGFVAAWAGADDARATITADHLLRMTAGIEWDETYDLGTTITEMLYTSEDMGAFMEGLPLEHAPGDYFEYSTGSTNLLCSSLLDQIDADANLPRDLLLAPLGLPHAQWETDGVGTPACGSYLWATPREWAAIGQFLLDDGTVDGQRLLPEGWLDEAVEPVVIPGKQAPGYGSSWWLNQHGDGGLEHPGMPDDMFWASGHDGQFLFVIPSEELVVLRMGFSPNLGAEGTGSNALVAAVHAALGES